MSDMQSKKTPLIVVLGPTASGKTSVAISIAKRFNGEIISADSMQIYKEMSIGTAKPTKEEQGTVPHHLVDFAELDYSCSVAEYSRLAGEAISEVNSRGKLAILTGGTGLYIDSVVNEMNFSSDQGKDMLLRAELNELIAREGKDAAFAILKELDPVEAEIIDKNNPSRLIRAIEVCKTTGLTMTEYKKHNLSSTSRYNTLKIGLSYADRDTLYSRINQRVDLMLESGLLEEAQKILENNIKTAFQAIGYKELVPYFAGEEKLNTCIEKIKQESRRYAKRQLTWFRRDKSTIWFFRDEFNNQGEYEKKIHLSVDNFLQMCYT